MKKVLLSAVVALSTFGIFAANSATTTAQKSTKTSYVVRDTVPSDTTMKKDSTLLLK